MSMNMKHFIHIIILVFGLLSCEELEVINPSDPNYKLKAPVIEGATTHADTAIILTWQNSEEYTREFQINRKVGSSSYNPIATVSRDVLSYTDTSFSTDIVYNYTILSKVSNNLSDDSNEIAVEVTFPVPSDLLLTIISDSEIQLTWIDNCDYEAGYYIERDSGAGYLHVSEVESNITTYRDTSLNVGIDYLYRVAAYSNNNTSGWIVSSSINTSFPPPTNLTVIAINDTLVELNWTDNCSYEVGYYVERDSGLGFVPLVDLDENTSTYTDSSMILNLDYSYRVAAYTSINTSNWAVSNSINTSFPAPSNLTAIVISDTSTRLSWADNCNFEDGFRIERSTGTGFAQLAELASNVTTYVDNGLAYQTDYSYRIAGFTSNNISSWNSSTVVNIEFTAPSNLVATILNDSQIRLNWNDNSDNETGYRIERDSGTGYEFVTEVAANEIEYIDSGLQYNTSYSYRIAGFASNNITDWVNSSSVSIGFPGPTNLIAFASGDSLIQINWNDNSENENGYRIERNSGIGFEQIAEVVANVIEYIDTDMVYETDYTYRVAGYSDNNISNWITSAIVTIIFPAPTNLVVNALDDSQVQLTWVDNSAFEEGFRIERDDGSGFIEIGTVSTGVLEYPDTGLTYDQSYDYRVAAYTTINTSQWITVTVATEFPPPSDLIASGISDSEIQLTWNDNTSFESGFRIERDAGIGYAALATVPTNVTDYLDTGLTLGQSYDYRLAAYTSINTSSWLNITASTEFPAPSDLVANSVSDSELQLTWADNTGFETGFKIERNDGSGFTEIGIVSANITEYTDSGLTFGQEYLYRLAAYTSGNVSSWATIEAATEFPAPSDLTASSVSDSELQLTWTDNVSFETGFRIERNDGSGYTEIGTVSADVTEYADTDLTYGQSYNYRVAAHTSANTSSWVTITASTEFPAPSDLTADGVGSSEIQLRWTENTGYEAGFKIERDEGDGFTEIGTVLADVIEYTDMGLTYGQSYDYRVAAFTDINTSDYSTSTTGYTCYCVVDYDGNVYETIQIGDQEWMAENLKVTHYRDGTEIIAVTSAAVWVELPIAYFCYYDNNSSNGDTYGALYNRWAAEGNIAPPGWHVPSDNEWKELEMALGMSYDEAYSEGWRGTNEGSKLAGNAELWSDGNLVNNSEFGTSGFNALPGGYRHFWTGEYIDIGRAAYFWTGPPPNYPSLYRYLQFGNSGVARGSISSHPGHAIRLVKD